MHRKSGIGMLWILALITTTRADTCQVSPDEKEEIRGFINGYFNAVQEAINTNNASILNDWYLGHSASDVHIRVNPPHGVVEYTSLEEVVDPETGVYAMYAGYTTGATIIFTVGENLEFSCEERNETRRISVVSSDHYVGRNDQSFGVDDNLMLSVYEKQDGMWLLVSVEELVVEHEILRVNTAVSMTERHGILNLIISFYEAEESSLNSENPSILNDWFAANTVANVTIIGESDTFTFYGRDHVLNATNGYYAQYQANFHHQTVIVSIGANMRFAKEERENGTCVVIVKLPVRYAGRSDEMRGSEDELVQLEFVQSEGKWLLAKYEIATYQIQVNEGQRPNNI